MLTVTVERPAGSDRYGNPLTPATHMVDGCVLAPAGSSEQTGASATVEWDLDLLNTDPDADIAPQDVVVIDEGPDAGRYQVFGKPARYRSPWTGQGGIVARLKGVTG